MAVESSSDAITINKEEKQSPGKRTMNQDSEKGKACHQCRQKNREISAGCKKLKTQNKPCPLRYCRKCLLNRYGENAEVVDGLEDWVCPRCRDICNCSSCRPKKGFEPTGALYQTAKKAGFSSVVEYLKYQDSQGSAAETLGQIATGEQIEKDEVGEKANKSFTASGSNEEELNIKKKRKTKMLPEPKQEEPQAIATPEVEIMLPQGIPVLTVGGVELPTDDVGPALQFLEFCNTFSEVLDINNGFPESVLREIARGRGGRQEIISPAIQLHVKLLSLVQNDIGEGSLSSSTSDSTSWLRALGNCITESSCAPKELQLVFLSNEAVEYDNLNSSQKLRLLNFHCDEIVGTQDLRSWIEEENTKFLERKKEAREKTCAAKRKEKHLKQKLKDHVASVTLPTTGEATSSVSEHDHLVLDIKSESEKAQVEVLESINLLTEMEERSDALRTEPIMVEVNGRAYWRLRGCSISTIMLQETGNLDSLTPQEMWYTYNEKDEQVVKKHISSLRSWRLRACRSSKRKASENLEEEMTNDSPNNPGSPKCSMAECNVGSESLDLRRQYR